MVIARIGMSVARENVDRFLEAMEHNVHVSKAFPGCSEFALLQDPTDPGGFILYQEWEDEDSFAAYRGSEHMAQTGPQIFPLLSQEPDVAYYHATPLAT